MEKNRHKPIVLPPLFLTPDRAKKWIESALSKAVADPEDAWRQGSLTYVANGPISKTVVLRHWVQETAILSIYTDTRSGKWASIQKENRPISLLLYCPTRLVQLSLQASVTTETNSERTSTIFKGLSNQQRQDYQSRSAPGLDYRTEVWPGPKPISKALAEKYFGVVHLHIGWFDFISLHADGHQRLSGEEYNDVTSWTWCVP